MTLPIKIDEPLIEPSETRKPRTPLARLNLWRFALMANVLFCLACGLSGQSFGVERTLELARTFKDQGDLTRSSQMESAAQRNLVDHGHAMRANWISLTISIAGLACSSPARRS